MPTDHAIAMKFCSELHERLSAALADPSKVRSGVEFLLPQNSFRESCFCKGLVLPVVDTLSTRFFAKHFNGTKSDIHRSLRCEGFDTPMYSYDASQVGFSSHSRSNSYHPGDKSGRRTSSRRSPDFCIRFQSKFRMLGEMKYVERGSVSSMSKLIREIKDYLSIISEPTSDWGHDFGYGLFYEYGGSSARHPTLVTDWWQTDRIIVSRFTPS